MKNIKLKFIVNKMFKYITYLQNNGFQYLQDKEGNLIYIGKDTKEILHCHLYRPIKIIKDGKTGIVYENKYYFLEEKENK